jgi:4-amino-4-deoxy-L-arabinose transferase-like glycosyltransferase
MNMSGQLGRKNIGFIIALALLIVLAIGLRTWDISADLPAYFSGGGQDFTTDSSYLTLYAKTAVQFGTWDLFGFEPWSAFKISVVSGVSYLVFLLFGVSRATAAMTGTVLQMLGMILFLIGCAKYVNRQTLLLIAALLATNYLLILYARVPFSENGLLFLAGLTFVVYCYWFDFRWGKAAVGVLIALAALLGKSFGFLLVGGPMLYLLIADRKSLVKDGLWLLAPIVATTLIFMSIFHGEGGLFGFIYEYGVGEHGAPHGFSSPLGFFESLISISSSGLHEYTPLLSLFTYLALLIALVGKLQADGSERIFLFMLGWMLAWLSLLSPFNYHPVRYLFVVTIPMVAVLAIVINRLRLGGCTFHRNWPWWRLLLLILLNWYAAFAVAKGIVYDTRELAVMYNLAWIILPVGLVISALVYLVARVSRRNLALTSSVVVPVVLAALIMATDLRQFSAWFSVRTHMIDHASQDVADLLSHGAVIGGQYGPAVASDSEFGSVRLFLRNSSSEFAEQLRQYPVTHIAISRTSLDGNLSSSELLQKAQVLTTFWLRDNFVKILRVNDLSGNPVASRYHLSEFERAIEKMHHLQFAEANTLLAQFLRTHPHNMAALLEHYYLTQLTDGPAAAQPTIDTLYAYFGSDYVISLTAAIYYKHMAIQTGDATARVRSTAYFAKALTRSGEQAGNVRDMYNALLPSDRIIK